MTVSAARIVTPGGADNQGIGPKGVARNDDGTKTSASQVAPDGTAITQESEFHTEASGRFDARGNGKVLITLSSFAGTDSFTISFREAGSSSILTSIAFVRGTNATAAAIQTELRSILTGTDLTVVTGTTDEGPFTIDFNPNEYFSRSYPEVVAITGTGCTGVATRVVDPTVKRYLGETKYEGTTELVGPTIGTITVTAGVDEVQTVSFSAGTDGGTFQLGFRHGKGEVFAWDAELSDIKADLTGAGGVFDQVNAITTADAPTVRWATPFSLEVQFVDWDTTDSAVLTYDTTDASDALLFATLHAGATAAARAIIVQNWVKTIDAFVGKDVVATEVTQDQEYDVVFYEAPRGIVAGDFALAVTGTTNEDATPDENQALAPEAGIQLTYENGAFAGRPVRGGIMLLTDTLEDGGILEPATITVTTAGVLGSASVAYTEQATVGDSVFGEAINDTTGKGGVTAASADAASPVVFSGLVPGAYTCVLRTVADRALSAPSTKAFTVTSA